MPATALNTCEPAPAPPGLREARFYEPLAEGRVRCVACAHRCVVLPQQMGICGVRANKEGKLYTLVYGKAVAAHVDPIEKKPLYHFLPGTRSFSIATAGCNLHCRYCQNWQISQVRSRDSELGFALAPEQAVESATRYGCGSLAYTYTEPTVFIEYALDTAREAKRRGLKNVFVTNGYYTEEALEEMLPLIDAANVDLKSFRDGTYRKVCGATLKPVLDSISRSFQRGMWIEVTTLVIPGLNDSDAELRDIAQFLAGLSRDLPWHLSRFFPAYRMTDRGPTPVTTLNHARDIGRAAGLHHVYVGNVGGEREDTTCPQCGEILLVRSSLRLLANYLRDGACPRCRRPLAGVGLAPRVEADSAATA